MPDNAHEFTLSKNGVPIRLPEERWRHIIEEHRELSHLRAAVLEAVNQPDRILAGAQDELLALRSQADGKVLVAVYREIGNDGFVITAFLTRRLTVLNRKTQLWPSPNSRTS